MAVAREYVKALIDRLTDEQVIEKGFAETTFLLIFSSLWFKIIFNTSVANS
jgi:hypothetical protein